MITLRNWNDLEKFGIVPLTGEACNLALRLLCDLTPRGKRIIESLFSALDIRVKFTLPTEWNGAVFRLVAGDPPEERACNSILLPYDLFRPLAVMCLVDAGCEEIFLAPDKPVIGQQPDDFKELVKEHGDEAWSVYRANLRYIYGTTPWQAHDPSNNNCPRNTDSRNESCSCAAYDMLCCRTIKVPGRTGSLALRTRNTHAMTERTI